MRETTGINRSMLLYVWRQICFPAHIAKHKHNRTSSMAAFEHGNIHFTVDDYFHDTDPESTNILRRQLEEDQKIVLANFEKCKIVFPFNNGTLFNRDQKVANLICRFRTIFNL